MVNLGCVKNYFCFNFLKNYICPIEFEKFSKFDPSHLYSK